MYVPLVKYFKLVSIILSFAFTSAYVNELNAQPLRDTFFINSTNLSQFYKHIYVYKTDKNLSPKFVADSLKPEDFFKLSAPSYNNTTSLITNYWLLVTIKNLSNNELFYYSLNSPTLYLVTAFTSVDNFIKPVGTSGYSVSFALRQTQDNKTVFNFMIEKNKFVSILLHISNPHGTDAFFYPVLTSNKTYTAQVKHYNLIIGSITGIMLIASLMNIFFGVSLKEKIHYVYAFYIVCIFIEFYTLEGLTDVYIGNPAITDVIAKALPPVTFFLMTKIMQWFLNQKRCNSYLRLITDITAYFLLFTALLHCLNYFAHFKEPILNFLQTIVAAGVGLQLLLILLSAIEKTIQRVKFAWVYLCATIWLLIGVFEFVLAFLGVNDIVTVENRVPNDLQLGLLTEAIIVFIAIIYRYNFYKLDKEKLLVEINQQQQNLLNKIVEAEEEERMRIAADLHDDIGPTLSTLNLHITNLPSNLNNAAAVQEYYKRSIALSAKAVEDIHSVAHNLLPKDFKRNGLFYNLQKKINELNSLMITRFFLITDGDDQRLENPISIIIYRIINELAINIIKHAAASEATIQLLVDKKCVEILSEDNGKGFDTHIQTTGMGLKNIERRVGFLKGNLVIDSNNTGTHTLIHLAL